MSTFLFLIFLAIFMIAFKSTSSIPWPVKIGIGFLAMLIGGSPSYPGHFLFGCMIIGGLIGVVGLFQGFLSLVSSGVSAVAEDLGASKKDADEIGNVVAGAAGGFIVGQAARGMANTVSNTLSNPNGLIGSGVSSQSYDTTNAGYADQQYYGGDNSVMYADSSCVNYVHDTSMLTSYMDGTAMANIPTFYNNPDSSLLGLNYYDVGQQNFVFYDSMGSTGFIVDTNGNVFGSDHLQVGQFRDSGYNGKEFVDMRGHTIFTTSTDGTGTKIYAENHKLIGTVRNGTLYAPDGTMVAETVGGYLTDRRGMRIGSFRTM